MSVVERGSSTPALCWRHLPAVQTSVVLSVHTFGPYKVFPQARLGRHEKSVPYPPNEFDSSSPIVTAHVDMSADRYGFLKPYKFEISVAHTK